MTIEDNLRKCCETPTDGEHASWCKAGIDESGDSARADLRGAAPGIPIRPDEPSDTPPARGEGGVGGKEAAPVPDERAVAKKEPMKWEESGVPTDVVGYARAFALSPAIAVDDVATAISKICIGRGLGITDFESVQYIHAWTSKGKQSMQLGYPVYAALINRSTKYQYRVHETTGERCEVHFFATRSDGSASPIGKSEFTIEQAKNAGLVKDGSAWKAYPETMLFARALTRGAKMYCADIFMGFAGAVAEDEGSYLEGEARVVTGEEINPWAGLHSYASANNVSKAELHKLFGVAEEEGALAERANQLAEMESKSVGVIVATMRQQLERFVNEHKRPEPASQPDIQ